MPRARWRPQLGTAHRWLGLTAGLLLMLNALTGALMLGVRPLDRLLNAPLFSVQLRPEPMRLEAVRQRLRADHGEEAVLTIRPPRVPGESVIAYVRSPAWEGQAFFDPYTGGLLGARGDHEGFANFLFELHASLLAGDRGQMLLAFNAATMLAMLVTGLLLWWPRSWRGAFSVNLRRGLPRGVFDLHRVAGALLGAWVMVCVATGAWMAWRPISQWVTQVSGQKPLVAPSLVSAYVERAATVDEMVANAATALPGGIVGYVVLPGKPLAAVRIRKKLDDDPHPNGLSSVWLHPQTGTPLRVDRWTQLDIGSQAYAWIYPLHAGKLGGALGVVATAAGGLLLVGFGLSGTWLWWLRRKTRSRSQKRPVFKANQPAA